jgi:hypothetical protein
MTGLSSELVPPMFADTLRALQALTAESNDHFRRTTEDATTTFAFMMRAGSPMEAYEILEAFQRRTFDEQSQHVGHMIAMSMRTFENSIRSYQALLPKV